MDRIRGPKRDIPESPATFLFYQDFITGDRKMNKEEYWSKKSPKSTFNYKMIHSKLKEWKTRNNITERCVVHHRDDTDETRKYNEAHYELWGLNEDGTFEYGKYIVFMTQSEHLRWHREHLSEETHIKMSNAHKGEKHPMYGKHHSDETRVRISNAQKGKKHSEQTCAKMSVKAFAVQCGIKVLYTTYKNNGGMLKWNDFRKALANGEIAFEMLPITIYTNK